MLVFVGLSVLLWMGAAEVGRLKARLDEERDMSAQWSNTAENAIAVAEDWRAEYERLKSITPENPYAHLLGKIVEARVYEASDWEPMVVVAVSWKGSVAVRRVSDPESKARWIRKDVTRERVRMVYE